LNQLLNNPFIGFDSGLTLINAFSRKRKAISRSDWIRKAQFIPAESCDNGLFSHFLAFVEQQGSDCHDMAAGSS
jgi:hypothetical protein